MEKKRPVGVMICGLIFILVGSFCSLMSIIDGLFWDKDFELIFLHLPAGLLTMIVGLGLLKLKSLARVIAHFILAYWIFYQFLFFSNFMYTKNSLKGIIINSILFSIPSIVIILFLNRPKVKRQFIKEPTERNPEQSEG